VKKPLETSSETVLLAELFTYDKRL
jgi:hypothetical protein